jgi:DNA-binding PadR family transcriptional regulator
MSSVPRDLAALAVLALLREEPNHPYGLQAVVRERHMDVVEGRTRALYHAVERLQATGLIEPLETTREGRRPERTVYQLTPRGHDELRSWLMQLLSQGEAGPAAFSAALSLIHHLPPADAVRALEARKIHLECGLEVRYGVDRVLRQKYELPRSVLLDHEFQQAAAQAELAWVQSLLDDLHSAKLTWDDSRSPFAATSPEPVPD